MPLTVGCPGVILVTWWMVQTRCLLAATRHHCDEFFWMDDPVCIPETIGTPLCPQQADDDHCGKQTGPYDACCVLVANGGRCLDMSGPVPRSNSCVCLSPGEEEATLKPGRTQARRATSNTRADSPPGRHVKDSLKAMQVPTLLSLPTESAPLRLARRRFLPFASCVVAALILHFVVQAAGRVPPRRCHSSPSRPDGWRRRPQRRPGGVEKPASCTGFFDTTRAARRDRAAHDGCASVPGIDPDGSMGINR